MRRQDEVFYQETRILPLFGRISIYFCNRKRSNMSKTIIERMCSISEKMRRKEDSHEMSVDKIGCASSDIRALKKVLEMSSMQVVILTAIVQRSSRYRMDGSDLAESLGMEYLKFLTYNAELEGLRKKGYIRIDKDGDIVIPKTVLQVLKENRPVVPERTTGLDAYELLTRIKRTLSLREGDQCTTREAVDDLMYLMEQNPDNSISKSVRKYASMLLTSELMIVYGLIYRYHFEEDDIIGWHDLDDYVTEDELDYLKSRYHREQLNLQTEGIIEYTGRCGLIDKDFFHLKDNIKEEIFVDTGGIRKDDRQKVSASRRIEAASIAEKELFYNPAEERQVTQLRQVLSEDRYSDIRSKLRDRKMRSGFTCLFYGSPGTGKTETVYQLARGCGRDIFMVDVSQIKSCWVGESEKNIKDVFDKYRHCVAAGGTVPILLFNEADAIFGIRQTGAERAVDKMENSIQNIILQEMEDLDGILIATTNLTSNLDKAFERRFLYKIRFDKPSAEARGCIWRSMLPELSETETLLLAADFDFSGGQIENIVRKKTVKALISGQEPTFEDIREYCSEETMDGRRPLRKIGF